MKVLVTGGAGFIGSAACRLLIAETDWSVLNFDKLTYAANLASLREIEANPRYAFQRGDIADGDLVASLLSEFQPDAILNFAAESHVDRSIAGSAIFIQTNIVGVHVLVEAARRYWERLSPARAERFRFLQVSTDEVFGALGRDGAFVEETRYDPRSPYSASKAAADHIVRAWGHTYGVPILITNCSNNYGPHQFPEKFIPLMILNALEGLPLPVYGDGGNVRDWLHVDDHVRALKLVLEQGAIGETYAIGGRSERSNLRVAEAICDLVDELAPNAASGARRKLISFVPDRLGHDWRYAIDCAKIERDLGWRPSRGFETGLRDTVRWYLEHRDWWGPIREAQQVEHAG